MSTENDNSTPSEETTATNPSQEDVSPEAAKQFFAEDEKPEEDSKDGETSKAGDTGETEASAGKDAKADDTGEDGGEGSKDEKSNEAVDFTPYEMKDLGLPEGTPVDEELANGFLKVANEHKMSPELRDALVELQGKAAERAVTAANDQFNNMLDGWQEEINKDPDIGGDKWDSVSVNIGRLIEQYSDDPKATKEIFDLTGAGDNIHIAKLLNKVAKDVLESGPVPGDPPGESKGITAEQFFAQS